MRLKRLFLAALLIPSAAPACGDDGVRPPPPPPPPVEEDGHAFTYVPPGQAPVIASISLRGSFNDWGETAMSQRAGGSWRALVELDPGLYEYKFFINGAWPQDMCYDETWGHPDRDFWIDPEADGCVSDGFGGQNAAVMIGDVADLAFQHQPGNPAHVSVADGRLSVRFRVRQGQVRDASVTVGQDTFPMHPQLRAGLDEIWRAALPETTTRYGFTVRTDDGAETFGPYDAPGDPFRSVDWVGGAVGYQIFPERFWNGDPANDSLALATDSYLFKDVGGTEPVLTDWDGTVQESHCCHQYFGGDLQGIRDRLGHLEALGVTLVYLNPIFLAGSAHGYDTFDYFEVAPNFGDEALLRILLDEARARGIRVMWDFVPNHVGVGHWAFQDAVEKGQASDYWDWFRFRVPADQIQVGNGNHYDGWWGLGSLPELETRNSEVFEHLMDVARYWTEFGFDGIRVDVPSDIRNRSAFFPAFRAAAKSANPEVYLVGEIWERDPSWLQGDQFDALMNYAIGQGVIQAFANGGTSGSAAAQQMAQLYAEYPEASAAMQFNLISSHDTRRLLTKLGGGDLGDSPGATALARHRLASAMLYALPGVPITFQGDECAFLGGPPRDKHRYPMQWQNCDAAMVDHYRQLAELRGELQALISAAIRLYHGAGSLLSFYRGEPGTGEVLVMFNNAGTVETIELPAGEWTDAASGAVVSGSAQVEPLGWRYLRRR